MCSCVFDFAVWCGVVWRNVRCTQHDSFCVELQFCFTTSAEREGERVMKEEIEMGQRREGDR